MVRKLYKGMFVCLLGVFFISVPLLTHAQKGKLAKLIRKADTEYNNYRLVEAEQLFNEVMQLDPGNFQAAYKLGLINTYLQDYQDALRWYQKSLEIDPNSNDTVYLNLGLTYKRLNNYRNAREAFAEFKKRHKTEDEYYMRADIELRGCDFAESTIGEDPTHRVNLLDINSSAGDMFPAYLDQRQEDVYLVYTSHRDELGNKPYTGLAEPAFSDLYSSIIENDSTFGEAVNMGTNLNTFQNDGSASFTADGLTLYYSICNQGKKSGFGCSIYQSIYDPVDKDWGKPVLIPEIQGKREVLVNTRGKTKIVPAFDTQPCISRDGRTLYFVSDRDGGQGGLDIWYSRKIGSGWSEPINAGPEINTAFDDISPYLSDDADRLFFASKGHIGYGGYDLYYIDGNVGSFQGPPTNLRAPINSSYDDFGGYFANLDSLLYFTSNREGGMGSSDLYRANMIIYPEEPLEFSVHGKIRDKETKEPIGFAIAILYEYVTNENGEQTIVALDSFQTDQSATYQFQLEENKDYKILGNAPEYFANEEQVSTKNLEESTDIEQNIDIELEPIIIDKPIVLQNIYYDYDKSEIRVDAEPALMDLANLLGKNPNITIQLGSHTDTNGTEDYNQKLSERRAISAVKYLAAKGITSDRMTWFGFGESQPFVYPEKSDEDEQLNRRTEFRITSLDFPLRR